MELPGIETQLDQQFVCCQKSGIGHQHCLADFSGWRDVNPSFWALSFELGPMSASASHEQLLGKRDGFRLWWLGWHLVRNHATCGPSLTASMLLVTRLATAQDSLRNSMAGDAAAAAQSQQQASQLYTYKAGDFKLLIVPAVELDWNDNVNLTKTNAESDFIVQPSLQLTGSYPLTQRNLLSLSVGVSYVDYLHHSTLSGLRVSSDSQLSFDMYIKDFRINFHDRFSLAEDSSTESAVAGTALYGTFMNVAGLSITWDLEDLVFTLGYDHLNSFSPSTEFSYLNRFSELPLARAGLHLRPDLTAGLEATAAFTTYDYAVLNDNQSYSAGVYADWNPGSYLRVQPRVGYTIYQFQHTSESTEISDLSPTGIPIIIPTGESIQTQDLNAWYVDLTMSHQASKAATYGFSAGHEIRLGILSDVIEDYYFRPNINWTIVKDVGLSTSLFYEHGTQGAGNVTGNFSETYDWYGGSLIASYPLMKELLLSLNYRLTLRSSNIPDREYAQNLVGLRLSYQLQ
jgi:hypothetical protein